jgi:Fe-S-cluster containining protein
MDEGRDRHLRRDLDLGLRFTHRMGEETRREVDETAVTVLALVEELAERGAIESAALAARTAAQQEAELARIKDHLRIHLQESVDKYELGPLPDIDCPSLMHLCRGRCCTLHFPLSKQDLGERVVKWDYLNPYIIRQRESDGYCVHNDPTTHGCSVYERRPAVCRTYDCREDRRIWVDFEKKIPAIDPALEPRNAPVPHGEPPR